MSITAAKREQLVSNFHWMYEHGSRFLYAQQRPYDAPPFGLESKAELEARFAAGDDEEYDCFVFCAEGCFLTGLRDPSGMGYDGYGNTAVVLAHLHEHYTDPSKALPGAFVIFGADLGLAFQHMAVVGATGIGTRDPYLYSHGQDGVKFLTLEEEQTAHVGSTVFLSPAPLA